MRQPSTSILTPMKRPRSQHPATSAQAHPPAQKIAARANARATQAQVKPPAAADQHLQRIPLDQIDVSRSRIRRQFGPIKELAYSLGAVGLLQPIQVFQARSGYRLIAGERRLRAARMLGWKEIDALVRAPTGNELLLELVENAQRKFLTDAEEADALIRLVRDERHPLAQVAAQAGRSQAYVSKRIRVFEDLTLRSALEQNKLSVSMAEEFLTVPVAQRGDLVAQAIREHWDVLRLREIVHAGRVEVGAVAPLLAPRVETLSVPVKARTVEPYSATPGDSASRSPGKISRARAGAREAQSSAEVSIVDDLNVIRSAISELDPGQLTPSEERALSELFDALLGLARAVHRRGHRSVFSSFATAERLARKR
jgi:ParB family transcriptional regulator, chromosome partitioning protein